LSLKRTVFDIFDIKNAVTLKTGLGSVNVIENTTRGAGRVSGQGGQNSARSAEKLFWFAHPGFQFAHPAIRNGCPHPAHRTEADLREKASLATNQEGPLPSLPSLPLT